MNRTRAARRAKTDKPKRAYMSREQRRKRLLEVSAGIVESEGWDALNMSLLAERAGTSRQLVYLHFDKLEQLLVATAQHIFTDAIRDTQDSVAAHATDLRAAVKAAESVTLDLPPGRADALWQILAGTTSGSPELEKMRGIIRGVITNVWATPLEKELGLERSEAKAYAWMLVMAFWGIRQLIRDNKISRTRGTALFDDLVQRLLTH